MNKEADSKVKIAEELMRLRDIVKVLIDQFDEIASKNDSITVFYFTM
jgi:hypothetical protein